MNMPCVAMPLGPRTLAGSEAPRFLELPHRSNRHAVPPNKAPAGLGEGSTRSRSSRSGGAGGIRFGRFPPYCYRKEYCEECLGIFGMAPLRLGA